MSNKKYIMTREERAAALAALQKAIHWLWDGNTEKRRGDTFICYAIEKAHLEGQITFFQHRQGELLVMRSLCSLGDFRGWWMHHNPGLDFDTKVIQSERKRWMESLIQALEKSLKEKN